MNRSNSVDAPLYIYTVPDPCLSEPCDPNANCVRDGLLNSNFTCTCNPEFTGDGFNCTGRAPYIHSHI